MTPSLAARLEAVLLVIDEPVPAATLAAVVEHPGPDVEAALRALADEYTSAARGLDLRQVAGGWRLYTRAECAPWVERFVLDGQSARLTQAALETLAVIAYRQPVTRARISAVRGVNVDGVVRTLLARGLITSDCVPRLPDHRHSDQHAVPHSTLICSLDEAGATAVALEELPVPRAAARMTRRAIDDR
jgi:segregation and condensation protein B